MTAAAYSSAPAKPQAPGVDILRGAGLAVSVAVILIVPAALSVLAVWEAVHG